MHNQDSITLRSTSIPTGNVPVTDVADPWDVPDLMREFVRGFEVLAHIPPSVAIFGSARVKPDDPVYAAAVETARLLAQAGFSIITGGGPGIMEAGNKGAQQGGTLSIGCTIDLLAREPANAYVDISVAFSSFCVRKTMFVRYAQAFVIFPGGFGTIDELFEALALIQNKKIGSFPVILYDSHYWGGLITWIRETMVATHTIGSEDARLLILSDDPQDICRMVLDASVMAIKRR